jgi:hypothetical protein
MDGKKLKTCKACKVKFAPVKPMQSVCSIQCASAMVAKKKASQEAKKQQDERKADKAKRERLKTRSDWMKDAQREFNRYIRLRDAGRLCISCESELAREVVIGGGYDCGHFRSVGSAPHLRFDPRNAAGQCKKCNRYGAGRVVEFRKGLIDRHGVAFVDELEADQTPRKYTIEDLKQIIVEFRKKAKAIEIGLR